MEQREKTDIEKRQCSRYITDTAIGVTFSIHGMKQEAVGLLNDKSAHGIGIATAVIVPPLTMLDIALITPVGEVEEERQHFLGEVSWCKSSKVIPDMYDLGIKSHGEKIIH
jgi:hypothetical protein